MLDIALDLGTSYFRVGELGSDTIHAEPATVAYDKEGQMTSGERAERLVGRAPQGVSVVHPISAGIVKDFDAAVALMRYALSLVQGKRMTTRPHVTVSMPTAITAVEQRAIEEAVREAGAKQVQLFESVIAAAFGAGLPVDSPRGTLVLNLGAGVTEAAVVSLGGIVDSRRSSFGGRNLDEAIAESVRKEHAFLIGIKTAEELKCRVGQSSEKAVFEVRGRSLATGLPETVSVSRELIEMQVDSYCDAIVGLLVSALESSPPELVGDFMDSGIVVMGGGTHLHALLTRLRERTDMPITVAEEPETCVIRGLLASRTGRRSGTDSDDTAFRARGGRSYRRLFSRVQGLLSRG